MSITRSSVVEWTDKAQRILKQAQGLCTTSETLLQITSNQLSVQLPQKYNDIHDSSNQLKLVHDLISHFVNFLNSKVHDEIIKTYDRKHKEIEPTLREFEEVMIQLELVKVPKVLIDEGHVLERVNNAIHANGTNQVNNDNGNKEGELLLKDFISIDEIELLRRNIDIYCENIGKLHDFMDTSLKNTIFNPFNNVINKRYNKVISLYDEIILQSSLNNELVTTILKENSSLEQELVSLLEMLTNHYDQCVVGLNSFDNHDNVNLTILQNDSMEVDDVLKDLKSVYDIVINNEIRCKKFIDSQTHQIDSLMNQIHDLNNIYAKFKSTNLFQLIIFLSRYDQIVKKSSITTNDHPLDSYNSILDQLVFHYKQFLSVFKSKYLVELHHQQFTYPRKFLNKLNTFLNEELHNFQQDEKDRRKQWLNKYGDFIPKQFILPGDNVPAIIQIVTEGLEEDVQQEKELLDIIKKFMNSP